MITQIYDKYSTVLREAGGLRPEELGAVRLGLRLALDELQAAHRANIAELDAIAAELLEERKTLRGRIAALEAGGAGGGATVAPPPAPPAAPPLPPAAPSAPALSRTPTRPLPLATATAANGKGHRFHGSSDELRQATYAALRSLAATLGRTPSIREWNSVCQERYGLITVDGLRKRLGLTWSEICQGAALTANQPFSASPEHKAEDKAENAETPFC